MNIDETDKKILRELQKDARKSYRKIAKQTDISEGTAYNRIKKLEKNKIIQGYTPDIDYQKIGYDLTTIIGITGEGSQLQELEQEIAQNPNVTALYDVTGQYDAITIAKFQNRKQLNQFIKQILKRKDVKKTYTMLTLNTIKEKHQIKI
ncbi:DNA-binding transcriptional regulator Lrp family [Methanonatronarchaeum thermophilum]|uniref:DNA-binding transcriptional regulator Lrp family n=1 Tax=Methanonatronarchaeum thermophilum TaxID=1927129 RepID=A0A1Y3GD22_9EURY|nr:Lrp/AsnC family transcriptional regulator [Methanonatronarchaeum thermophilum]OUJ18094.1 DNA-binding transcriptional regulator Lrp family [Methanonatronarchaeum thermophilum]